MIVLEPARIRAWQSRKHRAAALAFATDRAPPGVWVECGVADGWSARYLLARLPASEHLHLLDSFEGLPSDWGPDHPRGTFATSVPTFDDPRVTVHVGLFHDTLPQLNVDQVALLHVDCDLYDSTMTVLRALGPKLRVGSVIAFDEAIGRPECLEHEGRAIRDWQRESGRRLTPIARTRYTQLVTEVTR